MYQSFFAGILFYPAFCVFRTRKVYVLVCRRLSVGSTNCSTLFFRTRNVQFYPVFCVCRMRKVYVLVCRRLSVGSTNCSTPFCAFRTRNVHLLVVIQAYPPARQTFNVES